MKQQEEIDPADLAAGQRKSWGSVGVIPTPDLLGRCVVKMTDCRYG
jgi:hypothetical protein